MLKLCGTHLSNYHNKVRIALLEKGVPFDEDASCKPSQKDEFLQRTPLGKVPWIEVGGTRLAESQIICEYLEEAYPEKPLLPKDPLARAKVRELIQFLELHVELIARRLYHQLTGGPALSDGARQAVERDLGRGLKALRGMVKFTPYIAGPQLTLADCAAFVHLPLVAMATRHVLGRDYLADWPELKPYLKMLGERPAFARVNDDRKAEQARLKEKAAAS